MSKLGSNKCVAQGAAAWDEVDEHVKIMKMLDSDMIKVEHIDPPDDEYYLSLPYAVTGYDVYHYIGPKEEQLIKIAKRGNIEEISHMIEVFHRQTRREVPFIYMPGSVQDIIVERNNKDEVNALLKYYGFCESAQMIMLEKWPFNEVMEYINVHGFASKGQVFIMKNWSSANIMHYISRHGLSKEGEIAFIKRGVREEIELYQQKHAFSRGAFSALVERGNSDEIICFINKGHEQMCLDEERLLIERNVDAEMHLYIKLERFTWVLLLEMFDKIEKGGSPDLMFFYFWHHDLNFECQKRLINMPDSTVLFKEYVKRYPIQKELHEEMLLKRSKEEVEFYLSYHSWLSCEAERIFFQNFSFENKRDYIEKNDKFGFNIITSLLKLRPVEYELLTMAFLKNQSYLKKDENMSKATYDEVFERIDNGDIFSRDEIVALFFRDEPELFEAYINKHDVEF